MIIVFHFINFFICSEIPARTCIELRNKENERKILHSGSGERGRKKNEVTRMGNEKTLPAFVLPKCYP